MMKYDQEMIDQMFNHIFNGDKIEYMKDCQKIQQVIKNHRNVIISAQAAHRFWFVRSNWWDASWLSLPQNDKEIIEYWDKFIGEWHKDD